jgi:hypothetical protein
LTGNYDLDSIFTYDETERVYKLNNEAWAAYYTAERARLEALGYNAKALEKAAAENIDLDAFWSAENSGKGSLARNTLEA